MLIVLAVTFFTDTSTVIVINNRRFMPLASNLHPITRQPQNLSALPMREIIDLSVHYLPKQSLDQQFETIRLWFTPTIIFRISTSSSHCYHRPLMVPLGYLYSPAYLRCSQWSREYPFLRITARSHSRFSLPTFTIQVRTIVPWTPVLSYQPVQTPVLESSTSMRNGIIYFKAAEFSKWVQFLVWIRSSGIWHLQNFRYGHWNIILTCSLKVSLLVFLRITTWSVLLQLRI